MNSILPQNKFVIGALLLGILFILVYRIDYLPLKFEEPRRALVAMEMIISGNYWVPTINGAHYYNKPPLFNWMVAGLFQLFEPNEWVERLPTLFSIIGTALTLFFFFRKKIGQEPAALAALFFVLSGHMLFYFSFQGEIDMAYSFIVLLQVITIFHFFEKKKFLPLFLISYLLMTVGFLMKGLPSIAFQGLTLLSLFIGEKKFKTLFHYSHFIGIGSSVLLIAGYFYVYGLYNDPELLLAKLTVESASRTTGNIPISRYLTQWITFPLLITLLMLPGSLLLLAFKRLRIKEHWQNPWVRYTLLFLLFNIPLYWISPGTRDRYLYMFLPFLYILLFTSGFSFLARNLRAIKTALYAALAFVACALMVLPFFEARAPIHWSVIIAIVLAAIGISVKKAKVHAVFAFLLVMITLRVYYDQVVFPVRKTDVNNQAATTHASNVLEITKEKNLTFVGTSTETVLKLPFRNPVVIKEIERLPYQFSFYYTSAAGKIIPWTDQRPEKGPFITAMENVKGQDIAYQFEMEGRTFALITNKTK